LTKLAAASSSFRKLNHSVLFPSRSKESLLAKKKEKKRKKKKKKRCKVVTQLDWKRTLNGSSFQMLLEKLAGYLADKDSRKKRRIAECLNFLKVSTG